VVRNNRRIKFIRIGYIIYTVCSEKETKTFLVISYIIKRG